MAKPVTKVSILKKPKRKLTLKKPEGNIRIPAATAKVANEKPDHLGPTERKWMSWKGNAFDAISVLCEGNNDAFNTLVDVIGMGDERADDLYKNLDDMNMRGEQINVAMEYCRNMSTAKGGMAPLAKLIELVIARDPKLIDYVNNNWKRSPIERAVPSGAHKYMHKKIVTAP